MLSLHGKAVTLTVTFIFSITQCAKGSAVECGKSQILSASNDKIVGGRLAKSGEFPWQASLQRRFWFGFFHMCGATLIAPNWVVTAAHCVTENSTKAYQIMLGATSLTEKQLSKTYHPILLMVIKHAFNGNTFANDIAMLKFQTSVKHTPSVNWICLPEDGMLTTEAIAVGWGATDEGGKVSDKLFAVQVPLMSRKKCEDFYGSENLYPSMLCAGYEMGGKDSCQGDSGGPLIGQHETVSFLVGIVSWGVGCARKDLPGVYTDVNHFLPWILGNMEKYG